MTTHERTRWWLIGWLGGANAANWLNHTNGSSWVNLAVGIASLALFVGNSVIDVWRPKP